jgi:hypothetical protein
MSAYEYQLSQRDIGGSLSRQPRRGGQFLRSWFDRGRRGKGRHVTGRDGGQLRSPSATASRVASRSLAADARHTAGFIGLRPRTPSPLRQSAPPSDGRLRNECRSLEDPKVAEACPAGNWMSAHHRHRYSIGLTRKADGERHYTRLDRKWPAGPARERVPDRLTSDKSSLTQRCR